MSHDPEMCGLKSETAKTLTKKHKSPLSYISQSYDRATICATIWHVELSSYVEVALLSYLLFRVMLGHDWKTLSGWRIWTIQPFDVLRHNWKTRCGCQHQNNPSFKKTNRNDSRARAQLLSPSVIYLANHLGQPSPQISTHSSSQISYLEGNIPIPPTYTTISSQSTLEGCRVQILLCRTGWPQKTLPRAVAS